MRHAIDLNPSFAEGHFGLAQAWQAHALDAAPPTVPATSLAAVYNALGDTDAALDHLERAKAAHDIRIGFIKVDARWNNLRGEPRFKVLMQQLGLPEAPAQGRY